MAILASCSPQPCTRGVAEGKAHETERGLHTLRNGAEAVKTVVVVQELLAQYRVPFYRQLRDDLRAAGVDLRLVHGRAKGARAKRGDEASLPWATEVKNLSLPMAHLPSPTWQPALRHLRGADLVIVEHANRHLLNYVLLAANSLKIGPPTAFWGHGANLQAANQKSLAERFKRWTAAKPHWWFAYTEGSALRVRNAGFPAERISIVQNSIDTSGYGQPERDRNPLGAVFVGSLHSQKRIDFLLHSAHETARLTEGFRLDIVGDGPERWRVEQATARHPWIRYHGPLFGSMKAAVTSRASLMLMPGLVGLGIIDAFAARTPIVTTSIDWHSPEIEYAVHGENAIILSADTTAIEFGATVSGLLANQVRLDQLREGCARASESLTIEAMVDRFASGVLAALDIDTSP